MRADLRQAALKLELLEGVPDDVLHVLPATLYPSHEIQEGVVAELEAAEQRVGLAHDHFPAVRPS